MNFLQSKNYLGLNCITDEIENELDIFIKMLVILYADDTVLFADSAVTLFVGNRPPAKITTFVLCRF
jgi:hypothetical protein